MGEDDLPPDPSVLFDQMPSMVASMIHKLYVIGDPPDYEPTGDRTVTAMASARGVEPLEMLYDLSLEDDGRALMMLPMFNYVEENHDVIREQLLHPAGVSGLSDGGAHCGMICDASIPTFMVTHWTRDRTRGDQLPLEWVVKKQISRHRISLRPGRPGNPGGGQAGRHANVIDHQALTSAFSPGGPRPARRGSPPRPAGRRLCGHGGGRRGDPQQRRRYRGPAWSAGARHPVVARL